MNQKTKIQLTNHWSIDFFLVDIGEHNRTSIKNEVDFFAWLNSTDFTYFCECLTNEL